VTHLDAIDGPGSEALGRGYIGTSGQGHSNLKIACLATSYRCPYHNHRSKSEVGAGMTEALAIMASKGCVVSLSTLHLLSQSQSWSVLRLLRPQTPGNFSRRRSSRYSGVSPFSTSSLLVSSAFSSHIPTFAYSISAWPMRPPLLVMVSFSGFTGVKC
jgi:hypothetical protein